MKIPWEYRNCRSALGALAFGATSLGIFFALLAFSPFLGPSGDTADAQRSVTAGASASTFVRKASAAAPMNVLHAPAENTIGSDSRTNDYQLERDSCCIGN